MTISDTLIILATLFSPLIAVQVQKWIERATATRSAKLQVFYDLMATRATRVAPKHVEALNKIDLEFTPNTRKDREVVNRWRIYADHLNTNLDKSTEAQITAWNVQADDLFADLLEALAAALGYPFDRVQLKRGIYYPKAHGDAEMRRLIFERAMFRVMTGEAPLSMKVTDFPGTQEGYELQKKVQESIVTALQDGALKIKNIN